MYCEACRNKQAQTLKNTIKAVGAGVLSVGAIAVAVITGGKIKPKE